MKAHGWVLPVLAEFFPKNPNLLGESCTIIPLKRGWHSRSGVSFGFRWWIRY